jgi:hypothetical protein
MNFPAMKNLLLLFMAASVPLTARGQNPAPSPQDPTGQNAAPAKGADAMAVIGGLIRTFQGAAAQDGSGGTSSPDPMAAMAEMMKAFQGGTNNPLAAVGGKPAVDFRELRALLPEEIGGLRRTNAQGKKTGAFGAGISEASGNYGEAGGPQLTVEIKDLGAMGPFGAMAGLGWTATEIDSESDQGYERTTEYNGRKGLEKFKSADKSGSASVMVSGRFMIEIKGNGIEPGQLKSAAESIDFAALERLANRPHIE